MIDVKSALRLYLVADPDHCRSDLIPAVESAISGGVTMVQLRARNITDRDHLALARRMCELCAESGLPFLVNDRIDIALAAGANGVHLGVTDLPLESARAIGGDGFIIGYSPDTDSQIQTASKRGADYLGIGPVYGTATKADAGPALGIDEFVRRVGLSSLPVVGIGGINATNRGAVLATGAAGVAVVSAILGAPDARLAARQLSRNS